MPSYPNLRNTPNLSQSSSTIERPQPRTVEELVEDINKRWMEEFQAKRAKWERMSHEARVKYIKAVFNTFLQKFAQDPQKAGVEFMQWLISPEGALAWPYIWKPRYRQLMINITSKAYQLALKYLGPGGVLRR